MSKISYIETLYKKIDYKHHISLNDFKKCLQHISLYENQKTKNNVGNSRYIFAGQYVYRGLVANYIYQNIGGTGQQIQHYLGNVFTNKTLNDLFYELHLDKAISAKPTFEIKKHTHIFTLAYLGFIQQHATEWYIERTIYNYFIKDTDHLLPNAKNYNLYEKLFFKAAAVLQQKIKLIHFETKKDSIYLHHCTIQCKDGTILAQHESVSEKYARKAVIKKAFRYLLDIELQSLEPERKLKLELLSAIKDENIKEVKRKITSEKLEKKSDKITLKREIREKKKKIAQYKNVLRTKNKQSFKDKNEGSKNLSKAEIRRLLDSDVKLSSTKRRILEDKLK